MKIRAALLSMSMLVLSSIAFAQSVPTPEQAFQRGKFEGRRERPWHESHQGEELDLTERRPALNLAGTIFEAKYARPGSTLIANFYHAGKFYIVRVPDDGVKRVFFQLAYFPPKLLGRYIAAHSLLRFEMKAPIELVAEMPDETRLLNLAQVDPARAIEMLPAELSGPQYKIKNVAVSAEAQWSKTDPKKAYNLKRGQLGAFMQVVRFVSMETRLIEFFRVGNPASQIELDANGQDLDKVLKIALARSQSDGISHAYSTLFYNCTTMAFEIVEKALNYTDNRLGVLRDYAQKRVPTMSKGKLDHYNGKEVMPIQLDESLAPELKSAYDRVILDPHHGVRGKAISDVNMKIIEQAEDTMKKAGLLTRSQARNAFLGCPQLFGAKK